MGPLRPLIVRAGRHLLRWRDRLGRATAILYLELLAAAIETRGYRCVKHYQTDDLPTWRPLLLVLAFSPDDHVRLTVSVRATPGRNWAFYEAGRGRRGYLSPCDDTERAADQVDALLKHRMFPSTW
ncbi:hypothetical protein BJY14_004663 [Actinomadura luteofluorescens]|uniref:Uncharacterized protein n=1 Tax=Actinomadura luteofluorescens TaxID=46163 RepID=A0A7Y9EK89_9ACTN|nr:hypothetical protein [Actinomadura luteofluorescens]NYD48680.1 hypothetical protein [Actinomadura luteofluorescens]